MMEEADWVAAMEAEPENCLLMGLFADWLDERNDPRAGLFRMLWEGGKVGNTMLNPSETYPYYSVGKKDHTYVCHGLWDWTHLLYGTLFGVPPVKARFALAAAWAEADESTREKWRLETLGVETANA